MRTVTILRPDITSDEVVDVLSRALGPDYHVVASSRTNWAARVVPADAETVLVRAGSNRVWRAYVSVVRQADRTRLRVSPGGLAIDRLINSFGIARKVTRVLRQSAELRMPG